MDVADDGDTFYRKTPHSLSKHRREAAAADYVVAVVLNIITAHLAAYARCADTQTVSSVPLIVCLFFLHFTLHENWNEHVGYAHVNTVEHMFDLFVCVCVLLCCCFG